MIMRFMYMPYEHFESKVIMIISSLLIKKVLSFYEYDMMGNVFSRYDESKVEMLFSPIESRIYIMNYVGLIVKTFFHEYELRSRLNMNFVGIST